MKHRNILLVNDDGIEAEGLRVLAELAAPFGELWVAAPESQCSAMSQRITIFEDLIARPVNYPVPVEGAWSVRGTPADCVKAALSRLLPVKPDLVLSGINNGWNTGFDIAYSGTIGAAMEARMQGVAAIALSNSFRGSFAVVKRELPRLLEKLLGQPAEQNGIWNVNFPGCDEELFQGVLWERRVAPTQLYLDRFEVSESEGGTLALRNRGSLADPEQVPQGTDVRAVLEGYVSVGTVRSMVL